MAIPIMMPGSQSSPLSARIESIARQNQQSKIAVVSSFQWGCILRTLIAAASNGDSLSLQGAFDAYRNHPDVLAYSARQSSKASSDMDGIILDKQKELTVKFWVESCSQATLALVQD